MQFPLLPDLRRNLVLATRLGLRLGALAASAMQAGAERHQGTDRGHTPGQGAEPSLPGQLQHTLADRAVRFDRADQPGRAVLPPGAAARHDALLPLGHQRRFPQCLHARRDGAVPRAPRWRRVRRAGDTGHRQRQRQALPRRRHSGNLGGPDRQHGPVLPRVSSTCWRWRPAGARRRCSRNWVRATF